MGCGLSEPLHPGGPEKAKESQLDGTAGTAASKKETSESRQENVGTVGDVSGGRQRPKPTGDEVFVGSIDQGTTSTRFIIFDRQGEPVASHQIEFENIYPESG